MSASSLTPETTEGVAVRWSQRVPLWLLTSLMGTAVAITIASNPKLGLVLVGAVVFVWLLSRSVDWATFLVVFVIYSNAAVVAVKFHGVPSLAGNGVVGLLAVPLLYYAWLRKGGIVLGPSLPVLAGLALTQFLGAIFARDPAEAWEGCMTFVTEAVVLYCLITNVVRTPEGLRRSVWAILLAGCVMGGIPLYQQLTGTFESDYGGFAQSEDEPGFATGEVTAAGSVTQFRLAGPIGEKNRYAQVMLMILPLALFQFGESTGLKRITAFVALGLSAAGCYLAFSRGTIVAAGLSLLYASHVGCFRLTRYLPLVGLALVGLLLTPEYQARMASLMDIRQVMAQGRHADADGALKGRATEMGAAALVFLDHPVLGVGPGMFKQYAPEYSLRVGIRSLTSPRQAHCLPLDVAAENGLLGLACLTFLFVGVARRLNATRQAWLVQDPSRAGMPTAFLLVICAYFTTGLFLHFAFIRYFWLMLALADCAAMQTPREDSKPPAPEAKDGGGS